MKGIKKNKEIINIAKVIFSNISLLLAGVATSFILPKILQIEEYGLYKIFNLYVTYIIILQFGIIEGIYIKYGGKTISDIDASEFSGYLKTLTLFQIMIAFFVALIGIIVFSGEYRFICVALAVNIIVVNITNLYQYLSQSIQRFTELSIRNVVKSILTVIMIFVVWKISKVCNISYRVVVILMITINLILLVWYIKTYKVISFTKGSISKKDILELVKVGFPLCLTNIISTLILSLDRQVVSIFFSTMDYAIYAFAYSLLTLISTIVTSISVVLFSTFKQQSVNTLLQTYKRNVNIISIFVSFMAIVYFPLVIIIERFLPIYIPSLDIFRIIIPGMMISSSIIIVMHNYFKVLNHNVKFFVKSIVILITSLIANFLAYYVFGTMSSISYASVIIMIIWYLYVESYLYKIYRINSKLNIIYLIIMSILFYICTMNFNVLKGSIIYFVIWILITAIMKKGTITYILKTFLKKGGSIFEK